MALRIYNTLTRSLQDFQPLHPPAVSMYVCGPTVYDVPHIGHARSAYIFDIWRRYLQYRKFQVRFVRNVTDVDDKIIDKARQELAASSSPSSAGALKAKCAEVAARYLQRYHETMDRLGVLRPDVEPKATEHVMPDPAHVEATKKIDASMTGFISQLITKNAAYPAGGDVYFSVRKFPGYGALSNRTLDELHAGARVEPGEQKEDPLDFALWKAAKPEEPSWNSPWGPGRPGWHIECSVMSTAYLGDAFDIHGGGVDLVFPHHENELAQARAIGKPFARYWIHNGLLTVDGEKMSKSLGNFVTVEQALEQCQGDADELKLFFLSAHYRSPLNYTAQDVMAAGGRLADWKAFLERAEIWRRGATIPQSLPSEIVNLQNEFERAMDGDLNTPMALAALDKLVNAGYQWEERLMLTQTPGAEPSRYRPSAEGPTLQGNIVLAGETLLNLGKVFGLFIKYEPMEIQLTPEQEKRLAEREAARKRKEFGAADKIRRQFEEEGLLIEDTARGPLVRRKR